jgi:hypothetical protein
MADAEDSKSSVGNHVRVQVPPSAPSLKFQHQRIAMHVFGAIIEHNRRHRGRAGVSAADLARNRAD